MPEAIYQGQCNICGWVSGVQALSARVAFVTQNYQKWSLQNVIMCHRTTFCSGTHFLAVPGKFVQRDDFIIHHNDSILVKKKCEKYNNCTCFNSKNHGRIQLLRDVQWFFVGESVKASNRSAVIKGLLSGPLTTCFIRTWNKANGNQCKRGCAHANSIVGYDNNRWYLQESIGKTFRFPLGRINGKFNVTRDGTWYVNRGTECEEAILEKASYAKVYYDFDRGNAYFVRKKYSVDSVRIIDKTSDSVATGDFHNIGVAKRRCSLLGNKCKGVAKMSSGKIELVEFLKISSKKSNVLSLTVYEKTQMVVYLLHATGLFLGIIEERGEPCLSMTANKRLAAPFFTSEGRFISYDYPGYIVVGSRLVKHNVDLLNEFQLWTLEGMILVNAYSNKTLKVGKQGIPEGVPLNGTTNTTKHERFDLGISGKWTLKSHTSNSHLSRYKAGGKERIRFTKREENAAVMWQVRQILVHKAYPFGPNWDILKDEHFKFDDKKNVVFPRDGMICQKGVRRKYLGYDENTRTLNMYSNPKYAGDKVRWSFQYGDIKN